MSSQATQPQHCGFGIPPVVSFRDIRKSFFGVTVLKGVSFNVGSGRMVGLVGENGAGKSTLMNLLGGNLRPDSGELRVNGKKYEPLSPMDATKAGIAFVHQELNLFPNLTIAENLHLTSFPCVGKGAVGRGFRLPWIQRRDLNLLTRNLLGQVGLNLAPETLVERLSAGERQLVEIAKALGSKARVLILDEPTTSLSSPEVARLFEVVNQLRTCSIAIVYITHALGDVLSLCDDVVVLRDGDVVGQGAASEFSKNRLISLMVGRQIDQLYPRRLRTENPASIGSTPLLTVNSVSQPGVIHDISFQLAAGEILGISGLMGAGRSELARILFGLDPHASGEILLEGARLEGQPRERIRRGLAFLTEDRRQEGLCLECSVADNLTLVTLEAHAQSWMRWMDLGSLKTAARGMRDAVRLSSSTTDEQPACTLSGGNQQKVVLGKWLLAEPKVLVLDEPTRGIDVGAKFEIYQLIHRLADRGAGVLVISSEIEELMGICDRILVMRQGEIVGELGREAFQRETLLSMALHTSRS